jgi:hypothetical protein
MYNWNNHKISENNNKQKHKDFLETNKKCVKNLLHTASDFSTYRKSSVEFKKFK